MYKLVAFDLDGTFFGDDHAVIQRNIDAIKAGMKLGVVMAPCSGRGPGFLSNLFDVLDLNKENEYCILGNGAIIIENDTGKPIYCDKLDHDTVEKVLAYAYEQKLNAQVFTPEQIYFYFTDELEKSRVKGFETTNSSHHTVFMETLDTDILKDKTVFKVLYQRIDMEYLHSIKPEIEAIQEGHLDVSFSSDRYLEINVKGTNKGSGLQYLANYLDIPMEETIGIGDSYNDLEMIADAGLGCAVANAIEPAKKIANYICESDHNHGGVGEVIEKFILNKQS